MKHNVKIRAGSKNSFIHTLISIPGTIIKPVVLAFRKLSRQEKLVFFVLSAILLVLIMFEGLKLYYANTSLVPTNGGEYVEVLNGDAKYFNPVLAKTDAERTISSLIYSSLVKVDQNNQPQPDLATSWEISSDGLSYTFHLRQDVMFYNGQSFDSSDVVATIDAIKDEINKSSLRDTWLNIETEAPDPTTVIFKLPRKYGPFIYNCVLGIADSEDVLVSLTSDYNGTGPYHFIKTVSDENKNPTVSLESNGGYYNGSPLIEEMRFIIAKSFTGDNKTLSANGINAVAGFGSFEYGLKNYSFKTGRNLLTFFNVRKEPLINIDIRRKISNNEKIDNQVEIKLVHLDAEPQISMANNLVGKLKDNNFVVNNVALSTNEYMDAIKNRDYDLLVYGYNWSYDKDPYMLWHSSQIDKNNFSGYSSKVDDIFLEDARMIIDKNERDAKYQQFDQVIKDQSLAIVSENEQYNFLVSDEVKNIEVANYNGRPESRFDNVASWYIREKRMRK